jgi:hypothetical protein
MSARRRYEVRVRGRLSRRVRDSFVGMDVDEVVAESVITGTIDDATQLSAVLELIQSLGLHVVSIEQVAPAPGDPKPHRGPGGGSPPDCPPPRAARDP